MYPVVRRRSMAMALTSTKVFPPYGSIPKPVVRVSLILGSCSMAAIGGRTPGSGSELRLPDHEHDDREQARGAQVAEEERRPLAHERRQVRVGQVAGRRQLLGPIASVPGGAATDRAEHERHEPERERGA